VVDAFVFPVVPVVPNASINAKYKVMMIAEKTASDSKQLLLRKTFWDLLM